MTGENPSRGDESAVFGVLCFIGIGSNLDRPLERCREAVRRLAKTDGIGFLRRAPYYKSEPAGLSDQPWFVNTVAEVRTSLPPRELLVRLKEIEEAMGRTPGPRWGPRRIDLDLLLYGQDVIREEGLAVPHPEMHRRRFVLAPLNEIAPWAIHPAFGVSMAGLMERLEDPLRVFLLEE
ncbi:MAG: 2-amino-4-hydroxy-6-hydroxymethyldihydropteridine diphosphokinase [Syntrophaceae bacterium]|nr:2-amino-4-hydroxy-6-hydroxymethyldihydropteridine diphosphokinase [Syntrophaceae bacterium]